MASIAPAGSFFHDRGGGEELQGPDHLDRAADREDGLQQWDRMMTHPGDRDVHRRGGPGMISRRSSGRADRGPTSLRSAGALARRPGGCQGRWTSGAREMGMLGDVVHPDDKGNERGPRVAVGVPQGLQIGREELPVGHLFREPGEDGQPPLVLGELAGDALVERRASARCLPPRPATGTRRSARSLPRSSKGRP